MSRQLLTVLFGAMALLAGPAVHAKKGGDGANTGGMSPSHMSDKGAANANSPTMGQDKGAARADQRKSDQGLAHDSDGQKTKAEKKPKKAK
jgi:hypothetical protein